MAWSGELLGTTIFLRKTEEKEDIKAGKCIPESEFNAAGTRYIEQMLEYHYFDLLNIGSNI